MKEWKARGLFTKQWARLHEVKCHQRLYWGYKFKVFDQPVVQWLPIQITSHDEKEKKFIRIKVGTHL